MEAITLNDGALTAVQPERLASILVSAGRAAYSCDGRPMVEHHRNLVLFEQLLHLTVEHGFNEPTRWSFV